MNIFKTFATTKRVLKQLTHDPRTIALIMLVPIILVTLLKYIYDKQPQTFEFIAPILLGVFPLFIMFLVTSIATLRERTTGTLDRLMTEPVGKLDFIFGYAIAFSFVGFLQASLVTLITVELLDVSVAMGTFPVLVTAIVSAFLGTSLGLFVSAFARNEFQAVQLVMPLMMPQLLLSGLFVPREKMSDVLERVSDFLPLVYSVEAMQEVAMNTEWTSDLTKFLLIVLGCGIIALVLGSITIRRQEKE